MQASNSWFGTTSTGLEHLMIVWPIGKGWYQPVVLICPYRLDLIAALKSKKHIPELLPTGWASNASSCRSACRRLSPPAAALHLAGAPCVAPWAPGWPRCPQSRLAGAATGLPARVERVERASKLAKPRKWNNFPAHGVDVELCWGGGHEWFWERFARI